MQLTDRRMSWLKEQYLQLYFEELCGGPMTADAIRVIEAPILPLNPFYYRIL
jgi:hypothetical protein